MYYDIVFLTPGMPFDGKVIEEASLGGSETASYYMAKELANLGHRVTVFNNTENPGIYDNVIYRPLDNWLTYSVTNPHDIQIVQRTTEPFVNRLASKLNVLWCHDLASGRNTSGFRGILWNLDKVILLSQFMVEQYQETYKLEDELIFKSRNGIDLSAFPEPLPYRNRKRLVYAARPERGLDSMLSIFGELLQKDPEFELLLAGYDNTVDHMRDFYAQVGKQAEPFGEKVRWVGNLSKKELYQFYNQSGIYVYPTPSPFMPDFHEVYCITMDECMASGLPVVSTNRGALPETLHPDAGTLIDGDPSEAPYREKFIEAVLTYANDDTAYAAASEAGRKAAKAKGWGSVAQEWSTMLDEAIAERNDDPKRLAYFFYKNNDIIPAVKLLEDTSADPELLTRIKDEYRFIESDEALKDHYKKNGEVTTQRMEEAGIDAYANYFEQSDERRFYEIERFIRAHPNMERVLDFGCGHGWCDVYMEKKVGRKWVGVDVDEGAIKASEAFRDKYANKPENLKFYVGDHNIDLSNEEPFDLVIISEVLEHCIDPVTVVNNLEKWVKPGGYVLITVPYGASEYGTWNWVFFRNHIWCFDLHDLSDMFGHKPEFAVDAACEKTNEFLGDPVGFYMVTYQKIDDDKEVQELDWDRKFKLQRPRQTVSANLIAGPACEDTLRWCLRSFAAIVDEIIIVDTGMSEDAKNIAGQFGCKLVQGGDPKVTGFDEQRNLALKNSTMDFVFWIDTDEHLINANHLPKYLRQSVWNGFGVRQNHFTIDANFVPDMPVRVFRNKPYDGKTMRFYGRIHEHPEIAMNEGPGPVIVLADCDIAHLGYLDEEIRRKRFVRNRPLLLKDIEDYPDRLLQKHFIMRDNCLLNTYEIQQTGEITEDMKVRARETRDLYHKYFLGKQGYAAINSFQYYQQALRVLGEGIDVAFSISANRDGIGDDLSQPELVEGRFINAEEFKKEVNRRIDEKLDSLECRWW